MTYAEVRDVNRLYNALARTRRILMGARLEVSVSMAGLGLEVSASTLDEVRKKVREAAREEHDRIVKNLESRGFEVPVFLTTPTPR